SLWQNFPNPFNPFTTVTYQIPAACRVSLRVYDLLGRAVVSLVDGVEQPGIHRARLDGTALASGVYICRLTAGGFTAAKKVVLVK
ncbi:MAG TPA: T9SS type A sorting domain-containing protein, partial [Bacteroidota bacterium]|nr:T9SS type A sorting domain-containing protein [Bacteroidota bacterium]